MMGMMDWMLTKMKLTEEEIEDIEPETEEEPVHSFYENIRLPYKKKTSVEKKSRVFYKRITSYEDCKEIIDNYKQDAICICSIWINENYDAQGMMNYLCGAVYALEGEIVSAGGNVYWLC